MMAKYNGQMVDTVTSILMHLEKENLYIVGD